MLPSATAERRAGFSIVEIVLVMALLALVAAPLLEAFGPSGRADRLARRTAVFSNQARGTLHLMASLPYATLAANQGTNVPLAAVLGSTNAAQREAFVMDGAAYTPAVSILHARGGTGNLVGITVTIEEVSLQTLKALP